MAEERLTGIEVRSFDYVPLEERHGHVRQLFFLWFGENAQIFAVVTGALGITMGLNVWWTLLAILIGNLLGALFMAFHSAQGPLLGLPQMIQSRAQFGYYGAILPLLLVFVMYVAFAAVDIVLAGQGLNTVFGWNLNLSMVLVTIPMTLLAIYGYDFIHDFLRYATWFYVAFFLVLSAVTLIHGVPGQALDQGGFHVGSFLLAISVFATWQISYAPYVSDYSRYFRPEDATKTFFGTYWGTVLSSVWLMALGAVLAALAPKLSTVDEIHALGGHIGGPIMSLLLAIGLIAPNATNIYGGTITALSVANNVRNFPSSRILRGIVAVGVGAVSVLVATVGAGNFMNNLENYMVLLLYFLIPWTAINLLDFYVIHQGHYRTEDFYDPKGSFGAFGWRALFVYFLAFLLEIPFMNTAVYQGPVSKAMGGADLAWIVGLVVSLPLYYWLARGEAAPPANLVVVPDKE